MRGIHIIIEKEQRKKTCFLAENSCLTMRLAEEESTKQ